jgi:hypothetical protein
LVQAFIALSSNSGNSADFRYVSVARIGKYEIRMFNGSPARSGDAPPLWIELFDHVTGTSVDSSSCHEIDDAVSAFDAMARQARNSNETSGPEAGDARD